LNSIELDRHGPAFVIAIRPANPSLVHPTFASADDVRRDSLSWNLERQNLVCLFSKYLERDFDMPLRFRHLSTAPLLALTAAALFCGNVSLLAQDSGMELHANSKATAADIGLPAYPGATLYKDKDNDAAVDMGFSFGDSHFRLMAASYLSSDSPDKILAFYRKPLSHYGEVLECNDGKPVGTPTVTRSGLTCSDEHGGNVQVNGHVNSKDHELRAGTPHQFRMVGIDKSEANATHFGLVYVQLPKDDAANAKSK